MIALGQLSSKIVVIEGDSVFFLFVHCFGIIGTAVNPLKDHIQGLHCLWKYADEFPT